MDIEIVNPDDVEGPINDVPETWSDEKMHVLDETCWCGPILDGKHLRHKSVFDDRGF